MMEFKFSCPACGQHIQATDAHRGMQIQCPACQKTIEVPAPAAPAPTAAVVSPAPPAHSPQPAPAQRPVAPIKKSKNKWVVICGATGLVALGAILFALLSTSNATDKPARPSNKTAAAHKQSTNTVAEPKTLSAPEIVQKVTEQYASLTNYSATGTAVSLMDMSKVDLKKMPGADKMPAGKASKDFKDAMSKPIRTETEFSIKLARADLYRVEWDTKTSLAPGSKSAVPQSVMKGAVWSTGEGDFLTMGKTKYTKMDTREMALATATGVSGGVVGTMPMIFFNTQSSPLNLLKTPELGEEEAIDGEDCYVLNGETMGMKVVLWIAKSNFLIKQKQMVFGGKASMPEVSDADMEKGLKQLGNMTPEQKAQAKAAVKNMKPMLSKMKGTMTETYLNIEINKPIKKEDFQYPMAADATLSKSLF